MKRQITFVNTSLFFWLSQLFCNFFILTMYSFYNERKVLYTKQICHVLSWPAHIFHPWKIWSNNEQFCFEPRIVQARLYTGKTTVSNVKSTIFESVESFLRLFSSMLVVLNIFGFSTSKFEICRNMYLLNRQFKYSVIVILLKVV